MYMMNDFYPYLPQLLGALLVGRALCFFGQNDKFEKNNLIFASLGFFILTFQSMFNMFMLVLNGCGWFTEDCSNWLPLFNTAAFSLAALSMIAGVFEYTRLLVWLHKIVTVPIFAIVWIFSILLANDASLFTKQETFGAFYLSFGLLALSIAFYFARFTQKFYNLKMPAITIFLLAAYYAQPVFGIPYRSLVLELALYILVIWSIYWTTLRQMKSELRDMTVELKKAKGKIPQIIQSSPFPVIISTLNDDRLLLANEKACTLFNIDEADKKDFKTENYYVDASMRNELLQRLSESPTVENFQIQINKPKSDEKIWLEVSARIMDYDNEVALYSAFKDITEQKKQTHDLFAQAVLDPLTGCYNRRQFQELALKEMQSSDRYNMQFCLVMMDIDHFKNVNDTHGHAFGDEVLKRLAKTCKTTLRESDIFARFGGEEFICLLPQTDVKGGMQLAERLRSNVEKATLKLPSGEPFNFTISIGVTGSQTAATLEDLIKCADTALYNAKESGRNQVKAYDASMPAQPEA